MFGMNPASLVLIAALFCCTVGTVPMHDGNSILKWINVQKVNLADLEPAGSELNTWLDPKIYVARTFHGAGTVPGKYVDKRAMFYYTQDGIWHETRQCEVLVYPRGSVSWVPVEQIKSLDNVIIGGLDPTTNEILRICRLEHVVGSSRHLMPGKLTPSGSCIGVYYGDVIKTSNYEVLVLNAYGKFRTKKHNRQHTKLF